MSLGWVPLLSPSVRMPNQVPLGRMPNKKSIYNSSSAEEHTTLAEFGKSNSSSGIGFVGPPLSVEGFPPPVTMLAANHLVPVRCSAPLANLKPKRRSENTTDGFPAFLPKEVEDIKDSHAIKLTKRIERVPVPPILGSENCIMSSFASPSVQGSAEPVVLLHRVDRDLRISNLKAVVLPSLGASIGQWCLLDQVLKHLLQ